MAVPETYETKFRTGVLVPVKYLGPTPSRRACIERVQAHNVL